MFEEALQFQSDLSHWDVSRVIDMSSFMKEATIFDSNLSTWNTSSFQDTSYMFYWVSNFTGTGVSEWDVSNIHNMSVKIYLIYVFMCLKSQSAILT
jgi:surface protein